MPGSGKKGSWIYLVAGYSGYKVVDPGTTPLIKDQLLTQEEYQNARKQYGSKFTVATGEKVMKRKSYAGFVYRIFPNKLSQILVLGILKSSRD
jgi:hypothetical protein